MVTSLKPANGPTDGGSTQTVLGLNFGWTDSTPSIDFYTSIGLMIPCTTTSWTTATSLMCSQPDGMGKAQLVTETLSFAAVYGWFTYDGALGCCRFRCTVAVHVAIKMRSRGLIDGVVQLQC